MALTSLTSIDKGDFLKAVADFLKPAERGALIGKNTPSIAGAIHNDSEGIPTVGYGLNLQSISYSTIERAFKFALTGTIDGTLTTQQLSGLALIRAWKDPNDGILISNASLIAIAQGKSGTNAQKSALTSLRLTDKQAESLLVAYLKGEPNLFKSLGTNLSNSLKKLGATLPAESQERLVLYSLYYNKPTLVGPGIASALINDDHAKFWYEVRYNHKNFNDVGLQNRRENESNKIGILPSAKLKDADAVLKAADTLFDRTGGSKSVYETIVTKDAVINAADKGSTSTESFQAKIKPLLSILSDKYAKSTTLDFVQVGGVEADVIKPGFASYANKTEAATNDLVLAGDGENDIQTGGGDDWIWSGRDDDKINAGAGNDRIVGGAGDDIIDGGTGTDTMNGGSGNDTYFVDNARDRVIDSDTGSIVTSIGLSKTVDYISTYTNKQAGLTHTLALHSDAKQVAESGITGYIFNGSSGNDAYVFSLPDDQVLAFVTSGAGADMITLTKPAVADATQSRGVFVSDISARDIIDLSAFDAAPKSSYDPDSDASLDKYYYSISSSAGGSTLGIFHVSEEDSHDIVLVAHVGSINAITEGMLIV